ncbi:hypothetical protein JAAARDRAFT_39670 [Jaapia argillacea MUCL 33604]|uniref:pH-response transcription factor pacC/RIM101 n=1 Tax=Jaapia argillacea MUCL 33604 TaxID=933084 RepID=A0A067PDJ9_9AGAM|nr:hypothetical protein JAAARDRAFT_39670 [Jaapia argillacea MUCL 33604]
MMTTPSSSQVFHPQFLPLPEYDDSAASDSGNLIFSSGSSAFPTEHPYYLLQTGIDAAAVAAGGPQVNAFAYSDMASTSGWSFHQTSVGDYQVPDVMAPWPVSTELDKNPIIPPAAPLTVPPNSYSTIQPNSVRASTGSVAAHPLSQYDPMAVPSIPSPHEDVGSELVGYSPKEKPKEKKHACWMCHKAFDRPSTLRKHLLVHTGEKAHACSICGRRFGVLSNLNRHMKRCSQNPANAIKSESSSDGNSPIDGTPVPSSSKSTPPPRPLLQRGQKRRASPTPSPHPLSAAPSEGSPSPTPPADCKPKRRRRAPSPSRWIPSSLRFFNLTFFPRSIPVPLSPVVPYGTPFTGPMWEERNSYDNDEDDEEVENHHVGLYHPRGWKGTLPGPGLMGKDMLNTTGKILVF